MLKLQKHPILNDKKIYITSDNQEINLASFPHHIRKKIEHLPLSEKNKIMEAKDLYSKINNKLSAVKRKAWGLQQGGNVKGKTKTSLLYKREAELIEYFGRMFSIDELLKIANEDWGLPVGRKLLEKFRRENAVEIEKLIERHKATFVDIRLAVKRSRIEELAYLFSKQKSKYERTEARDDLKLVMQIIEQIRKESEGDRLTIDGKVDVNYEMNITMHLQQEVFKTLNLKEIILGRVAARMNINPVKLIYSLHSSYYKRFSNVLGDYNPDEEPEMIYPSQMNYDFERIKKLHEQHDRDIQEAVVVEEQQDDKDPEKARKLKEQLLTRLSKKRKATNKASSEIKTDVKNKQRK
jgi:hypothetical protein